MKDNTVIITFENTPRANLKSLTESFHNVRSVDAAKLILKKRNKRNIISVKYKDNFGNMHTLGKEK